MPLNSTRGAGSAKGFGLTSALKLAAWVTAPAVSGLTYNSYMPAGGKSSAIATGGFNGPAAQTQSAATRFNGTSWSSIPNMPYDTFQHGLSGDGSSAISYGGAVRPPEALQGASASWNGTSWSGPPGIPTAQREIDGRNGSTPAVLSVCGNPNGGGGGTTNAVIKYNGSSFSTAPNYPIPVRGNGVSGDSSNAISYGGDNAAGTYYNNSYSFNGSAWSATPNLSSTRSVYNGFGPSSNAMTAGGYDGSVSVATTESFNGTSWATAPSIPNAGNYKTAGSSAAGSFTAGGAYLITTTLTDPTYFWTK